MSDTHKKRMPPPLDPGWTWDGDGKAIGPVMTGDGEARDVVWVEDGRLVYDERPPPVGVAAAVLELHARVEAPSPPEVPRKRRIMDPLEPLTEARENGILLVLDNGVRIECGGPDGPGAYLLVADRAGYEIGYWNAADWGENPKDVMTAILLTAVRGRW